MRILYPAIVIINAFGLLMPPNAAACGYDWVGECSSSVHLRINGTLDSFAIADCPSGIRYQSLHLGTLQNLSLANAKAITWESCINNVTGVGLKYRLYEQGGGAGIFQTLQLNQDYFTLLGPYTTRYRSKASNINLAAGLTVGKTYILEVYFLAEIDTLGDDFIPETTLLKNNNGQNYKLTFTYGGPTANPFVVIPTTVIKPKCHGDSNGSVGVSVWGEQTALFYNWSNIALNFYQQNSLPAGTYTVTVTGLNHVESKTIVLGEPELLAAQFSNIQPVACGGGLGSATVLASGGTEPFQYNWQNGQTTALATFLNSGTYSVSVVDANNCNLSKLVSIPGTGLIQQSRSETICAGESLLVGSTLIDGEGVYNILLPGNGGCDTILSLTVNEIDPAALLVNMPSNILVTCNVPSINLCAETAPNAFFQWSKDGIPATQTPCLLATAGGNYTLVVTLEGCIESKTTHSEEHLVEPIASAHGPLTYIMDCYVIDSSILTLTATTNAVGPQFEWILQGQVISTNDTCVFYFDGFPDPLPPIPVLTITDQYGCYITKQPTVGITIPEMAPVPNYYFQSNLCTGMVMVDFHISWGNDPFTVTWNDSLILDNEFSMPPGLYEVDIVDEAGCLTEYDVIVPTLFHAVVEDSPIPNWNTGSINIYEPLGTWYEYLWDDGETSNYRSGLAPGEYCVTISDVMNGCALDTCFTVHGSVSTSDLTSTSIQISPNPAAPGDWLEIMLPEIFWEGDLLLEIMDFQGKKIATKKLENPSKSQHFQIPTDLSAGIFLLRFTSANGQATGKVCLRK